MPRSLQPDRQLFVATLGLCLIGAVMVFSASAMTAREQFGNGYIFLIRQFIYIALGIAGMFWLTNTDYRKLRQPRVIFTGIGGDGGALIGVRSRPLPCDASLDSRRAVQHSAFGNGEAGRGSIFSPGFSKFAARRRGSA